MLEHAECNAMLHASPINCMRRRGIFAIAAYLTFAQISICLYLYLYQDQIKEQEFSKHN